MQLSSKEDTTGNDEVYFGSDGLFPFPLDLQKNWEKFPLSGYRRIAKRDTNLVTHTSVIFKF